MRRRVVRYNPQNDFYRLLGIPSDASTEQIQQAFRRKAKEVHPDRNPERVAWATEQFRRLNEAYEVLSDPVQRYEYDRQRRQANPAVYAAEATWRARSSSTYSGTARPPEPSDSEAFWTWYRNVKPRYTRYNDPYAAAVRNLFFSPYRYVLAILGIVFFANIVFISLAQHNGLMQRALQQEQTAVALALVPTQTHAAAINARCPEPNVRIVLPRPNSRVNAAGFSIYGTADHPDFDYYELYALARSNTTQQPSLLLASVRRPVRNSVLVEMADVSRLGATHYTLRLTVFLKNGSALPPCEVDVRS
ncbi:MAG: J domain-containing protein [Anaerolineae bacterium]|nr:J domain-containing protein [Anaerolineae bacterium]MDW8299989.1 J domain-containing protein [Anaerolineae bacterium]